MSFVTSETSPLKLHLSQWLSCLSFSRNHPNSTCHWDQEISNYCASFIPCNQSISSIQITHGFFYFPLFLPPHSFITQYLVASSPFLGGGWHSEWQFKGLMDVAQWVLSIKYQTLHFSHSLSYSSPETNVQCFSNHSSPNNESKLTPDSLGYVIWPFPPHLSNHILGFAKS